MKRELQDLYGGYGNLCITCDAPYKHNKRRKSDNFWKKFTKIITKAGVDPNNLSNFMNKNFRERVATVKDNVFQFNDNFCLTVDELTNIVIPEL